MCLELTVVSVADFFFVIMTKVTIQDKLDQYKTRFKILISNLLKELSIRMRMWQT